MLPRHQAVNGTINPYHFVDQVFRLLDAGDVVVCANGTASVVCCQVAEVKKGQRLLYNSGCASMGYDLPAAIGAAVANGGKRIICFAGDGSLQMNIQELQTLAHHRWPIKIFVLNNGGYISMRQTQTSFFGRLIGESPESGVSFPDFVKVARAYDIPAQRIESADFLPKADRALNSPGSGALQRHPRPQTGLRTKNQFQKTARRTHRLRTPGRYVALPRTQRTFKQPPHTGRGILRSLCHSET